jgi:uncharacterized membrane protein YdjX (TVP38/TMEM64 family)
MIHRIKRLMLIHWLHVGLVALAVAFFIFITPFATIYNWFSVQHVVELVQAAQNNRGVLIVFYLIFCLATLFLPITIFPIAGGVLLPFWISLPLNILAATAGSWLAFIIARKIGRARVEHFIKGKLKEFDDMTAQEGLKTVLFIRWTGIPPFLFANYALGLSGIKVSDYLLGTVFGIMPWMAIVTLASSTLWNAVLEGGRKGLAAALAKTLLPMMGLSILILGVTGFYYWRKSRLEKQKALPRKPE